MIKIVRKNEGVKRQVDKTHSAKTKNVRSDRIYYVLKGRLTVKGGNTQYSSSGTFKAVVVNAPPFDLRNERTL